MVWSETDQAPEKTGVGIVSDQRVEGDPNTLDTGDVTGETQVKTAQEVGDKAPNVLEVEDKALDTRKVEGKDHREGPGTGKKPNLL